MGLAEVERVYHMQLSPCLCLPGCFTGARRMGCAHGVATTDSRSRAQSNPTKSATITYAQPCHVKSDPATCTSSRPQLLEPTN
eukprot:3461584-Amphidinium_carterae.1